MTAAATEPPVVTAQGPVHDAWELLKREPTRWTGAAALAVVVVTALLGSPAGRALLDGPDPHAPVHADRDGTVVAPALAPGWWPDFAASPFFVPLPALHLSSQARVSAGGRVLLDPRRQREPLTVEVREIYRDPGTGSILQPEVIRVGDRVDVTFTVRNLGAETLRTVRLDDPVFGVLDVPEPIEPYGSGRAELVGAMVPPRVPADELPKLLLGTDVQGRDLAARLAAGSWRLLVVAGGAALLSLVLGAALGWLAARHGPRVVGALGRARVVLVTFPFLLAMLVIVMITGAETWVLVLLTAAVSVPVTARRVRDAAVQLAGSTRLETAIASGRTRVDVERRIVLPALVRVAGATALAVAAAAALVETSLGFVGLGPPRPGVSLGTVIADVAAVVDAAPGYVLLPGLLIVLATTGCLLLAEALGAPQKDPGRPRLEVRA